MTSHAPVENTPASPDELELQRLASIAWKYKYLLIGILVFAVLASSFYSLFLVSPLFTTYTRLHSSDSTNIQYIINSPAFINQLKEELEGFPPDQVKYAARNISVSISGPFVDISIEAEDAQLSSDFLILLIENLSAQHQELMSITWEIESAYLEELDSLLELNQTALARTEEQIQKMLEQESPNNSDEVSLVNLIIAQGDLIGNRQRLLSNQVSLSRNLELLPIVVVEEPRVRGESMTGKIVQNIAVAAIASFFMGLALVLIIGVYDIRGKK